MLRLQRPAEASGTAQSLPAQSLPATLGTMRISERPTPEALLQQTQALKTERHQVADALDKLNPDTPNPDTSNPEHAALTAKHQLLDRQIAQIVQTYHKHYGTQMLSQLVNWRENVDRLLVNEGATTNQRLAAIQGQLEAFVPELEAFFNEHTQQTHSRIWNQLTQARQRIHSREKFARIQAMIDSDRPVIANQLQKDDDQVLYGLFNRLSLELDNLIPVLTMPGVSDQQREQARAEISTINNKVDKISRLFETVIHRYKRLESNQLYPHQLPKMKETLRKGRRALDPTLADQDRRKLIDSLENPDINSDHLLDMSEEDFQMVFALLAKKPLSEAHKNTMKKNSWQLSDAQNLITQRGHDLVMVVSHGDSNRLVDSATGASIGTLDRVRWDRIQHELAKKGLRGASHISRQMILDDFKKYPTTEAQYQARLGEFRGTLRKYGGSTGSLNCRRPSSQPALSETLRYHRRSFQP